MEHKLKGPCNVCGKEVSSTITFGESSTPLYVTMIEKQWQRDVHVCKACQLEWYRTHARIPNVTTDRVMNALDSLNHVTGTRFEIKGKFDEYIEAIEKLVKGKVAYKKDTHTEFVIDSIDSTELDDPLWITARTVNPELPWLAVNMKVCINDNQETRYNALLDAMYININDLEFTDEVFTERNEYMNRLYRELEDGRKTKKN